MRMSIAGEGWTEPNIYLRKAQMQTSPASRTRKKTRYSLRMPDFCCF